MRSPSEEAPLDAAPRRHTDAPAPQPGLVWPGAAAALELHRGDVVRIEQVAGGQCVDLVAWSLPDPRERLSAARTRAIAGISPGTGDELWSGPPYERPLLALIADSAPGHDLLFPACSAREYAAVGCLPEPSCVAVQAAAAAAWGLEVADLPDPLNLWLRADVSPDGSLGWHSTPTVPGDHVELVAHASLLVIVNPCVDDVFGCSGLEPRPIAVTSRRGDLSGPPPAAPARARAARDRSSASGRRRQRRELARARGGPARSARRRRGGGAGRGRAVLARHPAGRL